MTMGFLDKIRAVGGGVSPELMQNGTLARGQIASIQPTGMTVSHGNDALGKQVCNVALDVFMDNTPPYGRHAIRGFRSSRCSRS